MNTRRLVPNSFLKSYRWVFMGPCCLFDHFILQGRDDLLIFDARTGVKLAHWSNPDYLAIDVQSGRIVILFLTNAFSHNCFQKGSLFCLSWSPDGTRIVSGKPYKRDDSFHKKWITEKKETEDQSEDSGSPLMRFLHLDLFV